MKKLVYFEQNSKIFHSSLLYFLHSIQLLRYPPHYLLLRGFVPRQPALPSYSFVPDCLPIYSSIMYEYFSMNCVLKSSRSMPVIAAIFCLR